MQMARNSSISVLRIIAIFLVILIHASSGYLNSADFDAFDWTYANWINSFSRFAVPLFVMISGALLLQKDENPKAFYSKRLLKIVPPFVFWTAVYLVYYFIRYIDFDYIGFPQVINIVLIRLKSGSNAHLWYLYMLVGLYLAIPFLRKMIRNCSKKEIELFLGLWFAALFFSNKWFNAYLPNVDFTFFSGYMGYLVLGYYLYQYPLKRLKWLSLVSFVACCLITVFGTAYLSMEKGEFDPTLYNYLSPNIALSAGFLFIAIQNIKFPERLNPFWEFIDVHSFGIYLCHILLLNYIHPLLPLSTFGKIPAAALLTLVSSAVLTYGLRKIPFGKYVSG